MNLSPDFDSSTALSVIGYTEIILYADELPMIVLIRHFVEQRLERIKFKSNLELLKPITFVVEYSLFNISSNVSNSTSVL